MAKSLIFILFMLLFACYDRKKEAIDRAIRDRESKKGNHLNTYSILRTVDTLGSLKVYYEAQINQGTQNPTIEDSLTFYETGDGILQDHP
jgi:hypothetical protein